MKFKSDLIPCTLIQRYKRFLVDVKLADQQIITVHCANSGSMKTCFNPGWQGFISKSTNPQRKLAYTLELVHNTITYICVNTNLANQIVLEALINRRIPEFETYRFFKPEVRFFQSRIDFLISKSNDFSREKCFIEIKSVSMVRNKCYAFPDAVTQRGLKHLNDLIMIKKNGDRAVLLFLLMRNDGEYFEPAYEINQAYSAKLAEAVTEGVEVLIYHTEIDLNQIVLSAQRSIRWN